MSTATIAPAPTEAAAATMNEPIPPTPITTTVSPARTPARETEWSAIDSGWASTAARSLQESATGTPVDAGTITCSARPPSVCSPSV